MVYPAEKLTALIPQDITVQSGDFDDKGIITTAGGQYYLLLNGRLVLGDRRNCASTLPPRVRLRRLMRGC